MFVVPKKKGSVRPTFNLKNLNAFLSLQKSSDLSTMQRYLHFFRPERLPSFDRPIPSLLPHSHKPTSPTFPMLCLPGQNFQVDMPSLRFSNGPSSLCSTLKLGSGLSEGKRHSNPGLPGRFFAGSSRSNHSSVPCLVRSSQSVCPGLAGKFFKVPTDPLAKPRLSRIYVEHKLSENFLTTGQSFNASKSTLSSAQSIQLVAQVSPNDHRFIELRSVCNSAGSLTLKTDPISQFAPPGSLFSPSGSDPPSSPSRHTMVDQQSRKLCHPPSSILSVVHVDRCLKSGLGSSRVKLVHKREVVATSTQMAHQQQGVVCRAGCNLGEASKSVQSNSSAIRQQISYNVYSKSGGSSFCSFSKGDKETLSVNLI